MSLLTICQNVAKECGFSAPSSIVSNTDETARRLLALADRSGKTLARYPWAILILEHTFSTASGTASYSLPSDMEFLLTRTLWNRDEDRRVYGPASPQDWQILKSGFITSTIDQRYRIKVTSGTKEFYIDPTPTATETIAFEYVSDLWCESSGGTGQTAWAADTDVGRVDEYLIEMDLKWRFLNSLGLPYAEEKLEFERELDKAKARDGGSTNLNMAKSRLTEENIVPETGFGS